MAYWNNWCAKLESEKCRGVSVGRKACLLGEDVEHSPNFAGLNQRETAEIHPEGCRPIPEIAQRIQHIVKWCRQLAVSG